MKLMSEQGLSSVAVTDVEGGDLLSAVSVTDIARVCTFPSGLIGYILTSLYSS